MQKKYQLQINNACTENWAQMQESQVGKYCSVCTKHVVDFTELSDDELIDLIEKSTGKLCGRFRESQLNRILVQTQYQERSTRFQQILAGLALTVTMSNSSNGQIEKSATPKFEINPLTDSQPVNLKSKAVDPPQKKIVKGTLHSTDSTHIMANIEIRLKGSVVKSRTNELGYFEIAIPENDFAGELEFEAFNGRYWQVFFIHVDNLQKDYYLRPIEIKMGDVEFRKD